MQRLSPLTGVLAVAIWSMSQLLCAQDQQIRFDLSPDEYAAVITQAREGDWSPVQVTAYEQGDTSRFAVVLERGVQTQWLEKHLLTPQEFQDQFEAYLGQGFRPVSVAVSPVGEQPRVSAIWQKRGEAGWHLSTGVSPSAFSDLAAEYRDRTLHAASVSGIEVAGQTEYVVLWEAGPAETEASLAVDPARFREEAAARDKKGFVPRSVQAFRANGRARLAVVWEKRPRQDGTEVRALASQNELNDLVQSQRSGKFRIQSLSSALIDGRPAFSVILKTNGR